MQISANHLFQAIQEDPKQAKEMLKSALQKNLLANSSEMASKHILKNANKLLDSLFSKLINGTTSKSEALKTIQNSAVFKQDGTAMNDMKTLLTLVQKEPKLSRFVAPLQDFLKHVSTLDAKNLNSQIQNSGIGLEAKLAKNSTPSPLANSIKEQIATLLKNLQSQAGSKQVQSSIKDIQNILNQKALFKEDVQALQKSLSAIASNISSKNPSKNIQTLLQNIEKLETLLNQTAPKNSIAKIAKTASQIINSLNNQANLNSAKIEQLQTILKDIALLTKSLDNTTLSSQEKQAISLLLSNQNTQNLPQSSTNLNTQDQLKLLTLKLKQSMEILDKQSLHVNQNQKATKTILNALSKELATFPSKQTNDGNLPPRAIAQDLKQTLLKLSDATSSSNNPAQKEINSIANKNLTHIQMHQLISYANSSINTYMPYAWEGLSEGSVAFKKGKDNSFYCQIDLELKMYGKVNMMLMLVDDKYINISIATQKESLKEKIQENLKELKSALVKVGLNPLHVKMKPLVQNEYNQDNWSDFSMSLRV